MTTAAVSRLALESALFNTLNVVTVTVFFHKSPGKPKAGQRGIDGLPFRVTNDGRVVQTGKAGANGKVEVRVSGGKATVELLHNNEPVSTYEVIVDDGLFDPVDKQTGKEPALRHVGIQQRLRHLGHQVGRGGPDDDGVAAAVPPPGPDRKPPPDPESDADPDDQKDDAKATERAKKNLKSVFFDDFNVRTERSILDFQADEDGIRVSGVVDPAAAANLDADDRAELEANVKKTLQRLVQLVGE
jgi:hypothetical protein